MTLPVDESIVKQSRKRLEIDRFYRIGLKANNLSKKKAHALRHCMRRKGRLYFFFRKWKKPFCKSAPFLFSKTFSNYFRIPKNFCCYWLRAPILLLIKEFQKKRNFCIECITTISLENNLQIFLEVSRVTFTFTAFARNVCYSFTYYMCTASYQV